MCIVVRKVSKTKYGENKTINQDITSNIYMGNSMPPDTLFCRPIPDFDEIWQAWGSTEETNPHQGSAHFNHF